MQICVIASKLGCYSILQIHGYAYDQIIKFKVCSIFHSMSLNLVSNENNYADIQCFCFNDLSDNLHFNAS